MPRPQHSPIALFAFPRFQHDFGYLLNSNALITDFTRALIDSTFENIMLFDHTNKDYKQFERTARAANTQERSVLHILGFTCSKIKAFRPSSYCLPEVINPSL